MMRAMREITKPVFWVVAVSFIGWMAYGQITDIVGGGRDVVLKVDGTIVRSQPFQQQYQATLEQYRRQQGGGRLSREDERQVQDRVADQFIQKILLDRAYHRFGITVSDDEIIQAARSSPPPQILQQVLQDATFQTNGQFDITKWQRYISSAGSEFASRDHPGRTQLAPTADPAAGASGRDLPDQRSVRHHQVAALHLERRLGVRVSGRAAVPRVPAAAQAGRVPDSRPLRFRREAVAHLA